MAIIPLQDIGLPRKEPICSHFFPLTMSRVSMGYGEAHHSGNCFAMRGKESQWSEIALRT